MASGSAVSPHLNERVIDSEQPPGFLAGVLQRHMRDITFGKIGSVRILTLTADSVAEYTIPPHSENKTPFGARLSLESNSGNIFGGTNRISLVTLSEDLPAQVDVLRYWSSSYN
ncbi:uncharacterized protein LOC124163940 [Ischnura elegans]|uniref:uncharacterized protein LOC124163940 n=1 Tax=Ischnura elegans TaxID=197161 RepID=UPI001ED88331|nr:uncharacterized protein LOC124163940 [Ischnura elegans]